VSLLDEYLLKQVMPFSLGRRCHEASVTRSGETSNKVAAAMEAEPERYFTAHELAAAIGSTPETVQACLSRVLLRKNLVTRRKKKFYSGRQSSVEWRWAGGNNNEEVG
jgi:predicted transcriptional regulator